MMEDVPFPLPASMLTNITHSQGFWPDGIYTPPSYEAMVYDLKVLKSLGFNMLRKHIKVETDLFYRACDEMGLLVIQDMPALRPLQNVLPNATRKLSRGSLHIRLIDLQSHLRVHVAPTLTTL